MAYLAMARKWRPKNFEDMVGQDHIAQTIRNAIEGKRISHAYLFTGTRGVGKTTSARILAKALNCKNGPTPIPCDICDNCKSVNAGNSMDVLEIDGASNNGVDNIRDLREQVKYAPMHGTYKIYVIDEVHMLTKSAFNALLKTLEEPPPHVIFIFATTEANKLPHTILSRVQRFDFKRISETHIRERLEFICSQESVQPEREALEAIARKADGSMRDALSLFDQVYAFSGASLTMEATRKVLGLPRDTLFDALLTALIAHDQKTCFELLQESHREGIETSELLIAFGEFLRNVLFSRQGVTAATLGISDPRYNELAAMAPELRDGDLIRFSKMISDLLGQLKVMENPRLSVELGFARMASLDRMVTLSQVLGQDWTGPSVIETEVKKKNLVESAFVNSKELAAQDILPSEPAPAVTLAPDVSLTQAAPPLEDDLDLEMESAYDRDSQDSDLAANAFRKSPVVLEVPAVPMQNSPSLLPDLWPQLLGELIVDRPLLGSHLTQTKLEWISGEASELRVTFMERSSFRLIGDDVDFKKAMQSFFITKVSEKTAFQVRFVLAENAGKIDAKQNVAIPFGSDDPFKLPIVNFILDKFEGREIH